jgi:hypothetical protein
LIGHMNCSTPLVTGTLPAFPIDGGKSSKFKEISRFPRNHP